jgi:hypothetical protein
MFVSENLIRNFLMFSGGMVFSIFSSSWFGVGECALDMMLLEGM